MHEGQVPERVLPVHHRAQNLSRQSLQLRVGAVLERHLAYVVPNVEGRIVFPAGKANIEQRGHDSLEVAGNQRQLGFDKPDAILEGDLTVKHADTGHVEGHALAFKMEEYGVTPGKPVTALANLLMVLHASSPIHPLRDCLSQFTKENRDASF